MKRCSMCGVEKDVTEFSRNATRKDGLQNKCKNCASEYGKQHYADNLDKIRERKKRYYIENKDQYRERANRNLVERLEYGRQWRKAHPSYYKDRYANNRDKVRERDKRYYAENRDKKRENAKRWRAENPDKARAINHRRRARIVSAGGSFTAADIAAIRVAQADRCWYCGKRLHGKGHIDHFIPLAKGGTNDPGNLRLACASCNLRKGAALPTELGLLL